MIEDCTALVLAGGDSSRMGQDKAVLELGGQTLLDRAIATMQQIFPKLIVSVRQMRGGVEQRQVCDEVAASGPLAGLAAGLAQTDTSWVFVLACDMPFVSAAVVEQLAQHREGCDAVVPVVGGYTQPLAAFYARSALDVMRTSLAGKDKSLRGVLNKLKVTYVSEAELRACDPQLCSFIDLDTPQDYQAATR